MPIRLVVASTNPVKQAAALTGFQKLWPDQQFEVSGLAAQSGVADQPMTDDETLQGAVNRVAAIKAQEPTADYWIGIEGGAMERGNELTGFVWVVIEDKKGMVGKGRGAEFSLPAKIHELVKSGKELGVATDEVFEMHNSKQTIGTVGKLTNSVVTRTDLYEQAVIMALIPFLNRELYN